MSDDAAKLHSVRFERPPVQQVTLSLFFEPRFDLLTSDIFKARNRWVENYPKLDEFPTTSPWRDLGDEGFQVAFGSVHVVSPNYVFSSADGNKSIRVQQDRFELVWRFSDSDDESRYVGYEVLRDEMFIRYGEFCAEIQAFVDKPIDVLRADVTYENLVEMDVRDFCLGILAGWKVSTPASLPQSVYSGMRFSDFIDSRGKRSHNFVAIDPGPDGVGTNFIVDVQSDMVEGSSIEERLDVAHVTALELFFRLTSDQMRADWGQR